LRDNVRLGRERGNKSKCELFSPGKVIEIVVVGKGRERGKVGGPETAQIRLKKLIVRKIVNLFCDVRHVRKKKGRKPGSGT